MPLLSWDQLRRRSSAAEDVLTIGLVNNMPDAALRSTERQFSDLLAKASGNLRVALRVFSFPGLKRSSQGRCYVAEHHEPIESLWDNDFDGLIVTGAVPGASSVEHEPSWPALVRLVEWADRHTQSTIWSCLAAHAAVRHLDGIERQPLGGKLSGVFDCYKVVDHPLMAFAPTRWMTPHSRHNELPEGELRTHGYSILSRSRVAGADVFVKRCRSLFVFLQGHGEYDAGALGREYRRDVALFLAGKRADYPELPVDYFAEETADAMKRFRDRVLHDRDVENLASFPERPSNGTLWQLAAVDLYANWLAHLITRSRCRCVAPALLTHHRSRSVAPYPRDDWQT